MKPILFNTTNVQAIQAGRKTQTRRVIKSRDDLWFDTSANPPTWYDGIKELKCPYGRPGDLLWVRETFATDIIGCPDGITYRADHLDPRGDGPANPIRWKPSIFMPRKLSRTSLKVLDVRVERVQNACLDDLIAEGCPVEHLPENCGGMSHAVFGWFEHLWDSINAKRNGGIYSWSSNPLVWVVEFELQDAT